MSERWRILWLLFLVRSVMGFQFESVPALAPLVQREFGVELVDIGVLIGLYLSPGLIFALPGGAIGRRFGERNMVVVGLALMAVGGVVMAMSQAWSLQITGRLLAGSGAVVLNVLMAKMVTDWFAGREIATAMAVFVNSWPLGLAVGLVVIPATAEQAGLAAAHLLASGLAVAGLLALAALYRSPANALASDGADRVWPRGSMLAAVVIAGLVWGLYNAGLGMVFGFGPSMLVERGWSVAAAGSATSVMLWLVLISVPFGGLLSDRTGRPKTIILASLVGFGILLWLSARADAVLVAFAVTGLVGGIAAGPIMTLPAAVLTPQTRAVGMGLFFTVFYLMVVVTPWIAGEIATRVGTARATFDFGAIMQAACVPLLGLYERCAFRMRAAVSPA